jgi:hypothetical protein
MFRTCQRKSNTIHAEFDLRCKQKDKFVYTFFVPAFDTIGQLQEEILIKLPSETNCSEEAESLLEQRQDVLISILSRAKPLSGLGFFFIDKPMIVSIIGAAITYIIVLLQFSLSENPNSK